MDELLSVSRRDSDVCRHTKVADTTTMYGGLHQQTLACIERGSELPDAPPDFADHVLGTGDWSKEFGVFRRRPKSFVRSIELSRLSRFRCCVPASMS